MYIVDMAVKGHSAYALLGLLTLRPMSGYDIRQLIPTSVGHFWNESYGNIYPALKALADQGFVTRKTQRTAGKPDRHIYALTDLGRKELTRWLGLPVEAPTPRNELLLKLFFGAHTSASVNRDHILGYRERHASAVRLYEDTARKLKQEKINDPQLPFWLLTLSYGRHMGAATIAWCDEALNVLENMEKARLKRRK